MCLGLESVEVLGDTCINSDENSVFMCKQTSESSTGIFSEVGFGKSKSVIRMVSRFLINIHIFRVIFTVISLIVLVHNAYMCLQS